MNSFMLGNHSVGRPIHRRAIKECSKDISRDWVNSLACRLTHDIQIIVNTFVRYNYFSKLESLININEYAKAKKKICVFPVTRPTLIFPSDPKVFIGIPKK